MRSSRVVVARPVARAVTPAPAHVRVVPPEIVDPSGQNARIRGTRAHGIGPQWPVVSGLPPS